MRIHKNIKAEDQINKIISHLRGLLSHLMRTEFNKTLIIILNNIFSLYFKINQFHQCQYLFKIILSDLQRILSSITSKQKLFFHYYIARMYLFQNDLHQVQSHLDKALQVATTFKNKSKILKFLIPVKILNGKMPSSFLLQKYKLFEYVQIVQAIKTGNAPLFDKILQQHIRLWIDRGLYFLLIKSKKLLMRNLIKNVYKMLKSKTDVSLSVLLKAFNFQNTDKYTQQELNCMIAGLCKNGFIKGYVLVDEDSLYLHEKNPFPFNPTKWNNEEF